MTATAPVKSQEAAVQPIPATSTKLL
jgi:hypothetical protein